MKDTRLLVILFFSVFGIFAPPHTGDFAFIANFAFVIAGTFSGTYFAYSNTNGEI